MSFYKKIGFFFVFCMSVFIQNLKAAHIVGGVITYECLGDGEYEFTIKMYRDCNSGGAQFDGPQSSLRMNITIFKGNSIYKSLDLEGPKVTKINGGLDNPCIVFPPNICVEEGIYKFSYFLPKSDEPYTVSYQRCCRNNSITNIQNPGGTGSTFSIEILPEAQGVCNSTPVFSNFPPILICGNSPLVFDHSATDKDGDQLVYEMCAPYKGGGLDGSSQGSPGGSATSYTGVAPNPESPPPYQKVQYVVPTYSAVKPMGGNPLMKIDPNTGLITGTPRIEGQFVVGICVSEYRNGVLLSKVRRDFQFNVTNCDPVVKSDIKEDLKIGAKEYVVNSCGINTIKFINESYQRSHILDFRWEFDINGQTETVNTWDAEVTFPGIGTYMGKLLLNPGLDCSDTADIFVNVFPEINADFDYTYDTCIAGPVDLIDKSYSGSGQITDWQWNFGDGDFSDNQNTTHQFSDPGKKNIQLTVVDSNQCVGKKVLPIYWVPAPKEIIIDPSTINGCAPEDVYFDNLSTPIDSTYDIVWDFGDGQTGTEISPYHNYELPGTYSVSLSITSPIGCFISKNYDHLVKIRPSPTAGFSFTPHKLSVFQKDAEFFDESIDAVKWEWHFGDDGPKSYEQNPAYSFPDTGFYKVTQIVTHLYGCTDTLFKILDVDPLVNYFLPNAFSPNNDGQNEFFKGTGKFKGMKDFKMTIFNRWGEIIFESIDPNMGWNGRKNNDGKMSPPGVYVCIVSYSDARNRKFALKGFATLVQ